MGSSAARGLLAAWLAVAAVRGRYGSTDRADMEEAMRAAGGAPHQGSKARGTHAHDSTRRNVRADHEHTRRRHRPCTTEACLEEALAKVAKCYGPFASRVSRGPAHRSVVSDDAVAVFGALGDADVANLVALSDCVSRHGPDRRPEERPFRDHSGANLCWNLNWYVQRVAPELVERIVSVASHAARDAGPRFAQFDPADLVLRTAERIQYRRTGMFDLHKDAHSVYTMVLMLSDPLSDFEGGHFIAEHGHDATELDLPHFGGVLIRSDVPHGVTMVTRGKRDVFAVEFWTHQEADHGETRPDPRHPPRDTKAGGGGTAGGEL